MTQKATGEIMKRQIYQQIEVSGAHNGWGQGDPWWGLGLRSSGALAPCNSVGRPI